jgi:hypothetical protein
MKILTIRNFCKMTKRSKLERQERSRKKKELQLRITAAAAAPAGAGAQQALYVGKSH